MRRNFCAIKCVEAGKLDAVCMSARDRKLLIASSRCVGHRLQVRAFRCGCIVAYFWNADGPNNRSAYCIRYTAYKRRCPIDSGARSTRIYRVPLHSLHAVVYNT